MKEALIDPTTVVNQITGWIPNTDPLMPGKYIPVYTPISNSARVCEVVTPGNEFEVASPLFWTSCADNVVADQWYYDKQNLQFVVVPAPAPIPGTTGTQAV